MVSLKNPYISIEYDNDVSFGGNQRMADSNTIKKCGCGEIAALDLLVYLTKYHGCFSGAEVKTLSLFNVIPKEKYNAVLKKLSRSYFPVIPGHGMNGLGLMTGMLLYFKRYSLPYSCYWCISDKGIWDKVEHMLSQDLPVIMSIGPNFPKIWNNKKLALYTKNNEEYRHVSSVKAHFITVTGIDEHWLEVSSWGKRFYINRRLYEEYVSNNSAALVSNILYVSKKE